MGVARRRVVHSDPGRRRKSGAQHVTGCVAFSMPDGLVDLTGGGGGRFFSRAISSFSAWFSTRSAGFSARSTSFSARRAWFSISRLATRPCRLRTSPISAATSPRSSASDRPSRESIGGSVTQRMNHDRDRLKTPSARKFAPVTGRSTYCMVRSATRRARRQARWSVPWTSL